MLDDYSVGPWIESLEQRPPAGIPVLCSFARHIALTELLSTQKYNRCLKLVLKVYRQKITWRGELTSGK